MASDVQFEDGRYDPSNGLRYSGIIYQKCNHTSIVNPKTKSLKRAEGARQDLEDLCSAFKIVKRARGTESAGKMAPDISGPGKWHRAPTLLHRPSVENG